MEEYKTSQKTNGKMSNINITLSVITSNVNELNTPIRGRNWENEWKYDSTISYHKRYFIL